jgi:arsenite-transporting ATPase
MSPLEKLLQRRVLLVTGKGGVGKTTIAASLGRAAAAAGKRVLVAEISYESPRDAEEASATITSPLAGAFGLGTFADEPRLIEPESRRPASGGSADGSLYGARLSPLAGHLAFLRDTLPVRLLADAAMKSAAVRRFFHAAPTLAELGIVYRLLGLVKDKWDVIVCDLPATGHALALAQVPQTLADVLRAGPIHAAAQEGLALFRDPQRTTSVLVTLPEPLPVSEAVELHEGLHKLSVDCSLVVLNRVPPNPFTAEERASVERIVPDRMKMLGARRIPRIDRASAAHQRLERELHLPVRILQEMDADVIPRIARALAGAS